MSAALQLSGVSKSFGAVVVADELSYTVEHGDALGVIGPNGAGKTSMFNLITGTLKSDAGSIVFCGNDITQASPAQRCRAGIARSFQIPQPFAHMSVFENVLVGATQGAGESIRAGSERCLEILEQTGLIDHANTAAGKLTLLQRKRLELSRALAAKPRLLLLDEIAGGLTEHECQSLIGTIKDIHRSGMTIIWIEHIVHALMAVVDRLMVIDFGRQLASGDPSAIMVSRDVQTIYMGIDVDG
jgi:branched-chain amino acid transport system ATP-binding protein